MLLARLRPFRIPALLIVVSIVPFASTAARFAWFAGGPEVTDATPELAHFVAMPTPLVTHMVTGCLFLILIAFQFSPELRNRARGWHRAAGRVAVALGLVSALSGILMTLVYPAGEVSSPLMTAMRFTFGWVLVATLILGVRAAMRRDIPRHRAWMIRSFAVGVAGTTQAVLILPYIGSVARPDPDVTGLLLGLGWVVNLGLAEWIIRAGIPTGRAMA